MKGLSYRIVGTVVASGAAMWIALTAEAAIKYHH